MLFLTVFIALLLCIRGSIPSDFFSFSGGAPRAPDSDDGSYYKALGQGTNKHSSVDDIKKAYRKKAMLLHPDKGGDVEDFKVLSEAYEILSDPEKKAVYDKYGLEGLSGGGMGMGRSSSASDIAKEFFKGFGGFNMPLVFQLDLELEDFYKGKEINIPIDASQQVIVVIEPGMFGGQELVARAQYRGALRDVIVRLREVRHPIFVRKNADLLIDIKITITESILGFQRVIKLLDGTNITVKSPEGEVSGQDSVFMISNLGMPMYKMRDTERKGSLFIRTKLELPKNLKKMSINDKRELERLLHVLEGTTLTDSIRYPIAEKAEKLQKEASDKLKKDRKIDNNSNKKVEKDKSIPLEVADIRSFGQYEDDIEEDYQRSPFGQYFFR